MTTDLLLCSITVRLYLKQMQFITEHSATNKKEARTKPFADKSDCVRQIFDIGVQAYQLLQLKNNPEKWNEFQSKMAHITSIDAAKQVIDTMEESELDSLAAYLKLTKEKRLEQKILEFGGPRYG